MLIWLVSFFQELTVSFLQITVSNVAFVVLLRWVRYTRLFLIYTLQHLMLRLSVITISPLHRAISNTHIINSKNLFSPMLRRLITNWTVLLFMFRPAYGNILIHNSISVTSKTSNFRFLHLLSATVSIILSKIHFQNYVIFSFICDVFMSATKFIGISFCRQDRQSFLEKDTDLSCLDYYHLQLLKWKKQLEWTKWKHQFKHDWSIMSNHLREYVLLATVAYTTNPLLSANPNTFSLKTCWKFKTLFFASSFSNACKGYFWWIDNKTLNKIFQLFQKFPSKISFEILRFTRFFWDFLKIFGIFKKVYEMFGATCLSYDWSSCVTKLENVNRLTWRHKYILQS